MIVESYVSTLDKWMTEDFVDFTGELVFDTPDNQSKGTLILKKDNLSGLAENDIFLEVPVLLGS